MSLLYKSGLIIPSFTEGFARSRAESAYPELWDGLVACYEPGLGPQGGVLYDLAGRRLDGTLTNMDPATDWVVSERGYALDFDGSNDFVSLGDPLDVDFGVGNFAFEFWFMARSVTTQQALFGKDDNVSGNRQFGLVLRNVSNGTLTGYWYETDSVVRLGVTGNVVSPNIWYHCVLQRTSSTGLQIFLNGVEQSLTISGTATGAMQSGAAEFCLGKRTYSGFNNPFNGQIGRFAVYSRALTPSEIWLSYQGASPLTPLPKRWRGLGTLSGAGTQTFNGTVAEYTVTARDGAFVAGSATFSGTVASYDIDALDGSFVPGAVTLAGTVAIVIWTGRDGSFVGGAAAFNGTVAIVNWTVLDGSIAGATQTFNGEVATLTWTALNGAIIPELPTINRVGRIPAQVAFVKERVSASLVTTENKTRAYGKVTGSGRSRVKATTV